MKKIAKLIKFLIFFVFLSGLALIAFMLWVDPNEYKSDLTQLVLDKTGHTLKIEGPVSWSFFPGIGLKFEKIQLIPNPKAAFSVKQLDILEGKTQIVLLPLLVKRLKLEQVWLKDIAIELEKAQKITAKNLTLSGLNLDSNEQLSFTEIDIQSAKFYDPKNSTPELILDLNTKDFYLKQDKIGGALTLKLSNFPNTKITGALNVSDLNQKIPNITGKFELESIQIPQLLKLLEVDFKPEAHLKTLRAKTTFNFKNNFLILNSLEAAFDNGTLKANGKETKEQGFELTVEADKINLDKLMALQNAIQTNTRFQSPKKPKHLKQIQQNTVSESGVFLPIPEAKNMKFSGKIRARHLTVNKIHVDEIKATVTGEQGIIQVNPLTIQCLNSQHHLTSHINLQNQTPKISFTEKSDSFEISDVLKAFHPKKQITGETTLQMQLNTQGNTVDLLIENLKGEANFKIKQGKLYGADLSAILDQTESSIEKLFQTLKRTSAKKITNFFGTEINQWKGPLTSDTASTPFDLIQGNFHIQNQILDNKSLELKHSEYKVTGKGTYAIKKDFLDYEAYAYIQKPKKETDSEVSEFLRDMPLRVNITGPIHQLSYKPDLEGLTQSATRHFQKKLLKEAVKKPLNKLIEKLGAPNSDKKNGQGFPSLEGLFR